MTALSAITAPVPWCVTLGAAQREAGKPESQGAAGDLDRMHRDMLHVPLAMSVGLFVACVEAPSGIEEPRDGVGALAPAPGDEPVQPERIPQNWCALLGRLHSAVPAFKDERIVGIRAFSIRRGSFPDVVGLRNRDTIVRINGLSLTELHDSEAEVEAALGACRFLRLDIERNGRPIRLVYVEPL